MIYFDNAATSMPKPEAVKRAMCKALEECGNSGRSGHEYALKAAEAVYECRKKLVAPSVDRPNPARRWKAFI